MQHGLWALWAGVVAMCAACGDDGRGDSTATSTTGPASTTSTGSSSTSGTSEATESGSVGSTEGVTDASASGSTGTAGTAGSTGPTSSTGSDANNPPAWTSEPTTEILLAEALKSKFTPGQIFISSSVTDEIRVYDKETLAFVSSFTHPAFSEVDSPMLQYGPNGAAFNARGNLVVAAWSQFVEFEDYGVAYKTYPKAATESTENVCFDLKGNMYTTTATGGSDKLNQYAAADYAFVQTIALPPGAGQLTGITFDYYGRLYVASQSDNTIHFTDFNADFVTFDFKATLSGAGNPKSLEGLQFNANGELVAAAGDLVRYDVNTKTKLGVFDEPGDAFPVPLRVDNEGNIYTADYENGNGTLPADVIKFSPDGQFLTKKNDAGLFGPFGLALSGTVLAGDPPVQWSYELAATDPDGDPLTYELIQGPPGMMLDQNTLALTWYVTSADIGEYEVTLEVSDGKGGAAQQMFTLVVASA